MDIGYLQAILLGALQGLTEFFPVSSSGHLVLAQNIMGTVSDGVLLEVLLHVGTAAVVIWFYKSEVLELIRPLFDAERNHRRAVLVVGLIPTIVAGVFFKSYFERAYDSPLIVLIALACTGFALLASRRAKDRGRPIGFQIALLIGIAQAIAILPGVSRSGATIITALFLGVHRKEAAEFSFLLSVPAILGAGILTFRDLSPGGLDPRFLFPALVGTLVAVVIGTLALRMLVRMVIRGRFDRWGWYCLVIAFGGMALFLLR